MSGQGSLWDDRPGLTRADAPDTSIIAAADVLPRTGTQRRRVYDFIRRQAEHGATDEEIQEALRMGGNTERPRRVELVRDGLVVDSERRRTHGGRPAIVWVAVEVTYEVPTTIPRIADPGR